MINWPLKFFCAGRYDEALARTHLALCLVLHENLDEEGRSDEMVRELLAVD